MKCKVCGNELVTQVDCENDIIYYVCDKCNDYYGG